MAYFIFNRPVFLWLLLMLPLMYIAHYYFLAKTQKKAMNFANFITIKRIAGKKYVTKNITILILRSLVVLLLIGSLAQASLWHNGVINDFDYVIAIDNSASMLSKDYEPTRLEFAKSSIMTLLDNLNSDTSLGLVSFSTYTYILSPLTKERINLRTFVNSMNATKIGGTDLGNAIITSTNILASSEKEKGIILFTDGSSTVSGSMDGTITEAINYAKKNRVFINVIGIGTNNEPVGYLPESFGIKSVIDEEQIENIATSTDGKFIYPTNQNEIKTFAEDLNLDNKEGYVAFDFEFYGLIFAFILLFVEWILLNTIFRRVI